MLWSSLHRLLKLKQHVFCSYTLVHLLVVALRISTKNKFMVQVFIYVISYKIHFVSITYAKGLPIFSDALCKEDKNSSACIRIWTRYFLKCSTMLYHLNHYHELLWNMITLFSQMQTIHLLKKIPLARWAGWWGETGNLTVSNYFLSQMQCLWSLG